MLGNKYEFGETDLASRLGGFLNSIFCETQNMSQTNPLSMTTFETYYRSVCSYENFIKKVATFRHGNCQNLVFLPLVCLCKRAVDKNIRLRTIYAFSLLNKEPCVFHLRPQ